jgi:small subunit ribosomal protein S2
LSKEESGEFANYTKKEVGLKMKEKEKLTKFFAGIRTMESMPKAIIVIDPNSEHNAVAEAKKKHIPVIALCNTDAAPQGIDFVIPCNNRSIACVYLIISVLADAVANAQNSPMSVVGHDDKNIALPAIEKSGHSENILRHSKTTRSY